VALSRISLPVLQFKLLAAHQEEDGADRGRQTSMPAVVGWRWQGCRKGSWPDGTAFRKVWRHKPQPGVQPAALGCYSHATSPPDAAQHLGALFFPSCKYLPPGQGSCCGCRPFGMEGKGIANRSKLQELVSCLLKPGLGFHWKSGTAREASSVVP